MFEGDLPPLSSALLNASSDSRGRSWFPLAFPVVGHGAPDPYPKAGCNCSMKHWTPGQAEASSCSPTSSVCLQRWHQTSPITPWVQGCDSLHGTTPPSRLGAVVESMRP